jgi:hypothetical protein
MIKPHTGNAITLEIPSELRQSTFDIDINIYKIDSPFIFNSC